MKALAAISALFLTAIFSSSSLAQTSVDPQDPPDLVVNKFSWSKERLGWERDPFSGPVESVDEMRVRTRNEKRISDAKKGGNSAEINRIEREARADAAIFAKQREKAPPRYGFLYKLSVKNTGAETIKAIDWDYIFFDAETKVEVGRHRFTSEDKIGPGKTVGLNMFISKPPTDTISVYELGKKERERFTEKVLIVRIEYSDGDVWQRP